MPCSGARAAHLWLATLADVPRGHPRGGGTASHDESSAEPETFEPRGFVGSSHYYVSAQHSFPAPNVVDHLVTWPCTR